jgi:hypothetical protein
VPGSRVLPDASVGADDAATEPVGLWLGGVLLPAEAHAASNVQTVAAATRGPAALYGR